MPSLTCFNVRFTPNWLMIILALAFILLFSRLGFWQIQRADEKTKMIAAEKNLAHQAPIAWDANQKLPHQYQKLKVQGRYLDEILLLDNQHQAHQLGYDVLSPLLLKDGSVVIIDRGWVARNNTRQTIPDIHTPQGFIQLQGRAYFPSKNQWLLGPSSEKRNNKTTVLELLDVKLIALILQKKVYPFIIRLEKQDAYGFVRDWAIVSMPPQRHLAYALQWFAMALAILIIFVALNLKKKNEETKT